MLEPLKNTGSQPLQGKPRYCRYSLGFTVFIRGGIYIREDAFELTKEDSGTKEALIIYRAFRNEQVRFIRLKRTSSRGWRGF